MAVTAATILTGAKPLLNDPSGIIYSDAALLPLLKKAHRELQQRLTRSGHQTTKEVSAPILVTAGTVRLGDGAGLPTDLLYPVSLKEKAVGATNDNYVDMLEQSWEEDRVAQSTLMVWTWREDEIKFVGATVNREVLIRYRKGAVITSVGSVISILDCETFLESRTAAIAAAVLGENYSRAEALNTDAEMAYDVLSGTMTKGRQNQPVRRRRTRYRQ